MRTLLIALILFKALVVQAQQYFQQQVNYTIVVKLNDVKHELSARESFEYINNSHDTLYFLYMHLWPNAYKNNHTALAKQFLEGGDTKMQFAKQEDLGYIDSLDFRTNGQALLLEYDKENPDIARLILNEPLKPGDKVTISTPFHVKIPSGKISRLGHVDQAYTITQWYPKPAVYDLKGWHPMPYLNQGEFYSEYGSFDVSITLPANYVLGATGDMVDGAAELEWLENKVKTTEKKIENLGKNYHHQADMSFPVSSDELKTLRFKQNNVHDFAWFCDKRFNVLKGEVVLPYSKRSVSTWAMFTNDRIDLWQYAIGYINDATFFYSLWNGDYQYRHVTAVDGTISAGGGMEYPNITVIGTTQNAFSLETVIMHEVGHNWFYGMLGSNEREHAWMDEGINSFNELRYIRNKYPNASLAAILGRDSTFHHFGLNRFKQKAQYELLYGFSACQNKDQPCELSSKDFTEINYGAIVYSKTAILFDYLMNYMGEEDFDVAMQFYFDSWKFRHPQPADLRSVLEYYSEKNLSWFFDDLIGTTKKLDYKVLRYKKLDDGNYEVVVKNNGSIKGPLALCGIKDAKIRGMVWYDGFEGEKTLLFPPSEIDVFKIDYFGFMPEINRKNNSIRTSGLFKKCEPLKLEFIATPDDPDKTQLFWTPVAGYNLYNKTMLGLALYNHALFQKKTEYEVIPMYAFGTNDVAGYAKLQFNLLPKWQMLQQISFGVQAARFAYNSGVFDLNFNKLSPFLNIDFRKKHPRSHLQQRLKYRPVFLWRDETSETIANNASTFTLNTLQPYLLHDATYSIEHKRALNPYALKVNIQAGEHMYKLGLTANYSITLRKGKSIDIRWFAGKMFKEGNPGGDYRFRMSGQTGYQDYLYDNIYLGRNEQNGFWSKQFTETDGSFKMFTKLGQSDNWLTSLNIKSPRLFKLPVFLFTDIGMWSTNITYITSSGVSKGLTNPELMYSGGMAISIIKQVAEIYIPLFNSQNITDVMITNGIDTTFIHHIRFLLNLNAINPFSAAKNLIPE